MSEIVCVQGLGFVGSAMAVAVAGARNEYGKARYNVIGLDLPSAHGEERVGHINRGKFPFPTNDENLKAATDLAHKIGNLKATTDAEELKKADVIIVDVHLDIPITLNGAAPEFSNFSAAIENIGRFAKPEVLVIVETTVPPGTCENIVLPILLQEFKKRGLDEDSFYLAHSYERVMPGPEYLSSITNYWRVFSGYTEEAAQRCAMFLSSVINVEEFPLTRLQSTTASETAKVLENTYRAINIALIDEWTKFAEKINIDLHEVVQAISLRPTHSNIRYPGLGVGGYCLTKDPLFAPASAKLFLDEDMDFPFSMLAIETNNQMPNHTVQRIEKMSEPVRQKPIRVLLCGVTYRADVGDTRFSPSEILVRELEQRGYIIVCHDPHVDYWDETAREVVKEMPSSEDFAIVVLAVAHSEYQSFDFASWSSFKNQFLDANSVLTEGSIKKIRESGAIVEIIGRGVHF